MTLIIWHEWLRLTRTRENSRARALVRVLTYTLLSALFAFLPRSRFGFLCMTHRECCTKHFFQNYTVFIDEGIRVPFGCLFWKYVSKETDGMPYLSLMQKCFSTGSFVFTHCCSVGVLEAKRMWKHAQLDLKFLIVILTCKLYFVLGMVVYFSFFFLSMFIFRKYFPPQ